MRAGVLHVVGSSVTPKMYLKKKKKKEGRGSVIGANPVTGGRLCQQKPHGPRPNREKVPQTAQRPVEPTAQGSPHPPPIAACLEMQTEKVQRR